MCHVSHVTCHVSHYYYYYFFWGDKVVKLIGGVSVINEAYPVWFVSHYSLALYWQCSLMISGHSLDSTNSRGAPPSCTMFRRWYLSSWCPCRALRMPSPPWSRLGGRPGNEGGWILGATSAPVWTGAYLEVYSQLFFITQSLFLKIFNIKFPCHWNISGENILLSPTLFYAYWPKWIVIIPCCYLVSRGRQDDHLLHSLQRLFH